MIREPIPKSFIYCPKCSAQALRPSSSKSIVCTECGFEYFFNPAAAVAGIICNDKDELLVTVRAHDPAKGQWDLPGGFVDPGETAEQALAREIKEELNLDIVSMEYFTTATNEYTYKGVTYPTVDIVFICQIADFSTMEALDEIQEVVFISANKIDLNRLEFPSIRETLEKYIGGKQANS